MSHGAITSRVLFWRLLRNRSRNLYNGKLWTHTSPGIQIHTLDIGFSSLRLVRLLVLGEIWAENLGWNSRFNLLKQLTALWVTSWVSVSWQSECVIICNYVPYNVFALCNPLWFNVRIFVEGRENESENKLLVHPFLVSTHFRASPTTFLFSLLWTLWRRESQTNSLELPP